jgi:hypothetical protein
LRGTGAGARRQTAAALPATTPGCATKETIGQLWEARSKGLCVFRLATKKDMCEAVRILSDSQRVQAPAPARLRRDRRCVRIPDSDTGSSDFPCGNPTLSLPRERQRVVASVKSTTSSPVRC